MNLLQNLKLSTKLNVVLIFTTIIGLTICGVSLSGILEKNVEAQVNNKALLVIKTMNSVRKYTVDQVRPELASAVAQSSRFIPETVPSYSAKEVFEELAKDPDYQNYNYKEAVLNPTNLRDKADAFETELIEKFRNDSSLEEASGFRNIQNKDSYYVARPITIKSESCLECHSTPEAAPKSLVETYGAENGFNWQLNETVGAQVISVPASQLMVAADKIKLSTISMVFGLFMTSIVIINLFIKNFIVKPVKRMSALATKVSTSELNDVDFAYSNNDEIGQLSSSLNRMLLSLKMAIEMISAEEDEAK